MLITIEKREGIEGNGLNFLDMHLIPDGLADLVKNNDAKVTEALKSILTEMNKQCDKTFGANQIIISAGFMPVEDIHVLRIEIFTPMNDDDEGVDSRMMEKLGNGVGGAILVQLLCELAGTECEADYHVIFNTNNKKRFVKAQKVLTDVMDTGDTIEAKNDKA